MSDFADIKRFTQYFEDKDNDYAKDPITLTRLETGTWLLEIPSDPGDGDIGKLYLSHLDMKRFIYWLNKWVNEQS